MLENHPILRERLMGVTAISAILIGGAIGFDYMLTSGVQFGGRNATPSHSTAVYFGDLPQYWTNPTATRPQVSSAPRRPMLSFAVARDEDLDGAVDLAQLASDRPSIEPLGPAARSELPDPPLRSFDQIEADMAQALPNDRTAAPTQADANSSEAGGNPDDESVSPKSVSGTASPS